MKIDISDQSKTRFEFDERLEESDFPVSDEISATMTEDGLRIAGILRRLPRGLYELEFKLTGTLVYPCSRCLDPVEVDAEYDFTDSVECESEDSFDLLPYIEDCLFINEPTKVLCSEDCKGLCQRCGANLNYETCSCNDEPPIDPRMEALRELL